MFFKWKRKARLESSQASHSALTNLECMLWVPTLNQVQTSYEFLTNIGVMCKFAGYKLWQQPINFISSCLLIFKLNIFISTFLHQLVYTQIQMVNWFSYSKDSRVESHMWCSPLMGQSCTVVAERFETKVN